MSGSGTGRNASFSLSRRRRYTASTETFTTRRDKALECLKLRSLLRFVRSRSLVRIRSRPTSVLPVKKSALMLGAGCSVGCLLAPFFIVRSHAGVSNLCDLTPIRLPRGVQPLRPDRQGIGYFYSETVALHAC